MLRALRNREVEDENYIINALCTICKARFLNLKGKTKNLTQHNITHYKTELDFEINIQEKEKKERELAAYKEQEKKKAIDEPTRNFMKHLLKIAPMKKERTEIEDCLKNVLAKDAGASEQEKTIANILSQINSNVQLLLLHESYVDDDHEKIFEVKDADFSFNINKGQLKYDRFYRSFVNRKRKMKTKRTIQGQLSLLTRYFNYCDREMMQPNEHSIEKFIEDITEKPKSFSQKTKKQYLNILNQCLPADQAKAT